MPSRVLSLLLPVAVLIATVAGAASKTATLTGRILSPDGGPAAGYLAVVIDTFSDEEVGAANTDAEGIYRVRVPAGSRYRIVAAIDSEGRRLAVEPESEVDAPTAGEYELADTTYQARETASRPRKGDSWLTSAGGIAALTSGGLLLLVLALGDDSSDEPVASPFTP